jgi:sigma-B regulation protein RsbU (phosphoserine phosphatase)
LQAGVFMPAELDLLTTIAASAATAIENARLYEIAVEKGRLERELQLARSLQASFIPESAPKIAGWDIAARWYPAHEVSGDFYDFLQTEGDGLGVAIADVSDKGMGAALFMVLVRTVLRASIEGTPSPAAAIRRSNRLLYADANDGMFVTLFYLDLDPQSGMLRYVNAGHNPPLLFRFGETEPELLERTGILLGVDEQADFDQQLLHLNSGDLIFLYTDGIFDAHNSEMIPFGFNRVQELLQAHCNAPAEEILQTLMTAVQDFTGQAPSFDDITLVILKRL